MNGVATPAGMAGAGRRVRHQLLRPDLELYDENGNLISDDLHDDDTPVVSVRPSWTSQFRVHVVMADCNRDYCGYGVGVYIR